MRTTHQKVLLLIGVISFFITLGFGNTISLSVKMAVIGSIIALWWIFEVLPLFVTALVPIVAYPTLGIMSTKAVAPIYMSSTLLLFLGGFFVALSMQRWNLHKRIALSIISFFGGTPLKLIFGFITSCTFLSMWLSNTATCVMMVSIGLALIASYEEINPGSREFSAAVMLSIAYGCTIGGMSTLVGTPPNLAFTRIFEMSFPSLEAISFGQWMSFGVPVSFFMATFAGFVIYYILLKRKNITPISIDLVRNEKKKLGKISFEEKIVALVFTLMATLWIFRKDLNFGFLTIPGWSGMFENGKLFDDGTVAILMSLVLFFIPAKNNQTTLLEKESLRDIPWDTILLFGGGFALAKGIGASGLSAEIGNAFSSLKGVNENLVILITSGAMTFITEVTSNMASTEAVLPILASIARELGMNPLMLMIPTTLAASCAFMLPAATAPNAIVFGSGKVKIKDMVKVGLVMNIFSIIVIFIVSLFLIPKLL